MRDSKTVFHRNNGPKTFTTVGPRVVVWLWFISWTKGATEWVIMNLQVGNDFFLTPETFFFWKARQGYWGLSLWLTVGERFNKHLSRCAGSGLKHFVGSTHVRVFGRNNAFDCSTIDYTHRRARQFENNEPWLETNQHKGKSGGPQFGRLGV